MGVKARKFRIRRSLAATLGAGGATETEAGREEQAAPARPRRPAGGGAGAERPERPVRPVNAAAPEALSPEEAGESDAAREIEAIKAEGLTGRQLRMARRLAERHGLKPVSDLDAVRLLRRKGIDPFRTSNLLELVPPDPRVQEPEPAAEAPTPALRRSSEPVKVPGPDKLPATRRAPKPPSPQIMSEEERAREILQMQRDLMRRRRRRMFLLAVRLFFFVIVPTLITGFYYYRIATPMYATKAEFVIQKAESQLGPNMGGGLFAGTSFATSQDSITVQSYLQSREAMERLDREHDFKAHFQQPFIDPIQRLAPDASNEDAYRLYRRVVKVGYDPSEGIIKLEVAAADPQTSVEFARALISYAEEQVDALTKRLREDQMKGAREAFREAEQKMVAAQKRVVELQQKRGVLSADLEVSARMQQISSFEVELKNKKLQLAAMLDNPRPNPTKVELMRKEIQRLEELIAEMRRGLTEGSAKTESLAKVSGELMIAKAELETRQMLLSQALQQLETARIEANKQVRYLSLGVSPVAPDEPTYPRKFENTLLAFLIFAGIYLMISLTASILREQVAG
ncbi:MAG: capsule biosynthesis protein [Alphaproteobacteria bacterium]|nr:MAG: capsule biosynthesis protein [Alphaproteobacteria bacterium]